MRRFEGSVVLVTGAARGIGRGVALRFAAEGARVVLVDRDDDGCAQVEQQIREQGGSALPVVADLGDPAERTQIIGRALEFSAGRLDVLVHNAAIHGPRRPLAELTDADVRSVLEVNLIAPLLLTRDALDHLTRARGAVVFISSIQASLPLPTFVPYAASKGALDAITRALAVELAGTGVRVNTVAPGAVESPAMHEQWEEATGGAARPPAPTLIGRWGTDRDIAEVVTFLSSPAASFISGEVVRVDGGRLLSRKADPLNVGGG